MNSTKSKISNSIKEKLLELGSSYVKEKFEIAKEDIMRYVEKTIEKKIKKEIRNFTYSTISLILLFFGTLFLIFGAVAALVHLTNLPSFFTPLIIGLILILSGLIVKILK